MLTSHGAKERRTVSTRLILALCLAVAIPLLVAAFPVHSSWQPADPRHAGATSVPLGKGVFLVAAPSLDDPNFRQTVILICDHSSEGALGLVLNRPTNLLLSEALADVSALQGTSHLLFAGGPVQPDTLLMLFRLRQEPAHSRRVLEGIYLGGDIKDLNRLAAKPEPTEGFRAFAGYTGWGPGQLEWEMAQGSWLVAPADAASIFEKNPADLWQELSKGMDAPGTIQARGRYRNSSEALAVGSHTHGPNAPTRG